MKNIIGGLLAIPGSLLLILGLSAIIGFNIKNSVSVSLSIVGGGVNIAWINSNL